jgi:hypothetical protein
LDSLLRQTGSVGKTQTSVPYALKSGREARPASGVAVVIG